MRAGDRAHEQDHCHHRKTGSHDGRRQADLTFAVEHASSRGRQDEQERPRLGSSRRLSEPRAPLDHMSDEWRFLEDRERAWTPTIDVVRERSSNHANWMTTAHP
jgi:hypothetical protein